MWIPPKCSIAHVFFTTCALGPVPPVCNSFLDTGMELHAFVETYFKWLFGYSGHVFSQVLTIVVSIKCRIYIAWKNPSNWSVSDRSLSDLEDMIFLNIFKKNYLEMCARVWGYPRSENKSQSSSTSSGMDAYWSCPVINRQSQTSLKTEHLKGRWRCFEPQSVSVIRSAIGLLLCQTTLVGGSY